MKKHICLIVAIIMILSLTACGQVKDTSAGSRSVITGEAETVPENETGITESTQQPEEQAATGEIEGSVFLGAYPQNGESSKPIEWIVLDTEDDRVLLLAKDCIESLPWHNTHEGITWDDSDIRSWLNGEFLEIAFTEEEQEKSYPPIWITGMI